MAKAPKMKKPSGLTVTRNGDKFTLTWSVKPKVKGSDYKDADIQYYYGSKKPKTPYKYKAGEKDLKKTKVTFTPKDLGKYAKQKSIHFGVRDDAEGKKAKESKYKWVEFKINDPKKPSVKAEWQGSEDEYATNFYWTIANTGKNTHEWVTKVERASWYQWEGDKNRTWQNWGTVSESSWPGTNWIIRETNIGEKALIRGVRVRATGKNGSTPNAEASHVYSTPLKATDLTFDSVSYVDDYIDMRASWMEHKNAFHPIDTPGGVEFQYTVASPALGMAAPYNLDGTVVSKTSPTGDNDSAKNPGTKNSMHIVIDRHLNENECIFARVRCIHDAKHSLTPWKRAESLVGPLSEPAFNGPEEGQGNTWVITAVNNAYEQVPDSFLAIYYKSTTNYKESETYLVGIMEGYSGSVTVTPPEDVTTVDEFGFGVRAIAYPTNYYNVKSKVTAANFNLVKNELYIARYRQSTDTAVDAAKTYYILVNGVYTKVDKPTGNPTTNHYYERYYDPIGGAAAYNSSIDYYSRFEFTITTENNITYKTYTIDPKPVMQSELTWKGGEVPKAPSGIVTDVIGDAINVKWEWTWSKATHIELAWADHDDAWMSTDEPSYYRVPQAKASEWNINGLASGTIWYIRARFIRVYGDIEIVGPWSEIVPVNRTSAPNVPILELTRSTVSIDEEFLAKWTYVSTDTTPQERAEIFQYYEQYGVGSFRPAKDLLVDGFKEDNQYYIIVNDEYVLVENPVEEDLEDYYMFDTETPLASTNPGSQVQSLALTAKALGFDVGKAYQLVLRLRSESGATSNWSPGAWISVAVPLDPPPINVSIQTADCFRTIIETDSYYDEEQEQYVEEERPPYLGLVSFPIVLNVAGIRESDRLNLTIRRAEDFFLDRPDDNELQGYADELVSNVETYGSSESETTEVRIEQTDLLSPLDDEAKYVLEAVLASSTGQTAEIDPIPFTVKWDIQAQVPDADVEVLDEYKAVKIIPQLPAYDFKEAAEDAETTEEVIFANLKANLYTRDNNVYTLIDPNSTYDPDTSYYLYHAGDTCDIYRLSADAPQLIIENGTFGQPYFDPYPAFGENGGHRVVYKTANGDYKAGRVYAWIDLDEEDGDIVNSEYTVIDFDGGQIELLNNIDLSSDWKKDFKETKYLGGHIQGDWNPGVSRTGTISTVTVRPKHVRDQLTDEQYEREIETFLYTRRMADTPDICHLRTNDGSSFSCDIQVSENRSHDNPNLITYSFNYTKVESQTTEGLTLEEWNERIAPTP